MKPIRLALAACTLALLTACGGGDCDSGPECGPDVGTPPVDCKATPEKCK